MGDLPFDAQERLALCDLFDGLGADVPTLIEGWTGRDIAAHLVLRERDPIAGPCMVLPGPFQRFAERRRVRLVGLEIEWAGTTERITVRHGDPTARLIGAPGELLLYLFGRPSAARVEVTGPAKAVAAVHHTHFGM